MPILEDYKRLVKHGGAYRLSIPPPMRQALNLRHRDILHIYVEGNKIIAEKASQAFDGRKPK